MKLSETSRTEESNDKSHVCDICKASALWKKGTMKNYSVWKIFSCLHGLISHQNTVICKLPLKLFFDKLPGIVVQKLIRWTLTFDSGKIKTKIVTILLVYFY